MVPSGMKSGDSSITSSPAFSPERRRCAARAHRDFELHSLSALWGERARVRWVDEVGDALLPVICFGVVYGFLKILGTQADGGNS